MLHVAPLLHTVTAWSPRSFVSRSPNLLLMFKLLCHLAQLPAWFTGNLTVCSLRDNFVTVHLQCSEPKYQWARNKSGCKSMWVLGRPDCERDEAAGRLSGARLTAAQPGFSNKLHIIHK